MQRRSFIKILGAGTATVAGLTMAGPVFPRAWAAQPALPASARKPIGELVGAHPESLVALAGTASSASIREIDRAVREAALLASDFAWLSRNDTVLIKPVVNSGNPYPATTSPAGLAAMIRLLKEKGAGRVIVGDMSGIEHIKLSPNKLKGRTRDLMRSSGIAAAVEAAGGELHGFDEAGWNAFFEDFPRPGAHWKAGIMMPVILKEVDHIILMPRCGRHALAGASLGMKAAVGYWRTDSRLEYHRDAGSFQEKTAEANSVPTLTEKLRLVLTVADKVLTTFGPDRGYICAPPTGVVLASPSLTAHDMVSLAWLLENQGATPASAKARFWKDPYNSQRTVQWGNRVVTFALGGVTEAVQTENLIRNDITTIWDDRVLRRAFELFGGVPRLNIRTANDRLPGALKNRLEELTAVSTV